MSRAVDPGTVSTDKVDQSASQPATAEGVAYFETHIRPLLVAHCYSCHSSAKRKREGGLVLDSRAGWFVGGDRGPAVSPGNVDASLLIQAVRHTDPDFKMPPDKPLPARSIARLEQWVRMGAPDPRDEAGVEDVRRGNPSDPIAGREHWAFRPLSNLRPPATKANEWPRSTIDFFILSRLEAADLQPAPDADRRTLVRRVYVQLTGLPPTIDQIASFLQARRPDAYQRLVDQLLDSPHFGERWGRHWLDLARYADSNGLDENFLFREAWRYRNWVIDEVNANMPFDRFLLEQIAGDLLEYDSVEQRDRKRIAAGFLVVGPKVLLGNDSKKQRMEVADEQVDTIGRAILGQTLGCARCHDHKFDPIPTSDYYALVGILTSTKVMEKRHMLNQQRVMEKLVGLGPDGTTLNAAYEDFWRGRPKTKAKREHAQELLKILEKGDAKAFESLAAKHAEAVADGVSDASKSQQERVELQKALITRLAVAMKPVKIPPRAMIPADADAPADEHIRLAGQFDRLGDQVPRGFLRVISDGAANIPDGQSGRLELGRWLTDVDRGAGQLTARVMANRVWYHLIGRGLVRTVDNFGRTGEAPSHPQLLDYLARELIESGWSIKGLVRRVVLSRAFTISSRHNAHAHALDPDNRLLWRAHRRRLGPESLRDAMLLAAGTLDVTPMDSTVWYLGDQATAVGENKNRRRTDFSCRSVYLPVIRNDLPELFDVFDFADPHTTTGLRPQTMVATQGLFILNDDSVMDAALATARRLLVDAKPNESPQRNDSADPIESAASNESADHNRQRATVEHMYELLTCVTPSVDESSEMLAFITEMEQSLAAEGEPDANLRAWALACHALFASSRFQFLE